METEKVTGAAWCRPFWRVMQDGEPNPDLREAFLAVARGYQVRKLGSTLLDKLIERARKEGILRLVGWPTRDPERGERVRRMLLIPA
jgi:predicted N-acetyltransferase YhbS